MSAKNYEILTKSILTKKGLKKIGETISVEHLDKKRIEQFLKDGVIIGEHESKKAKKDAEQAKFDANASLKEVKEREAAVAKVQEKLKADIETFESEKKELEKEREEFEAEKAAYAKEIEDVQNLSK